MHWERVSEWDFILTELEYTVSQVEIQMDGIEEGSLASMLGQERSPDEILDSMLRYEVDFQQRYCREQQSVANGEPREADVTQADPGAFSRLRARTVESLRQFGVDPPEEIVDAVRQHLSEDRQHVTALAECRYDQIDISHVEETF